MHVDAIRCTIAGIDTSRDAIEVRRRVGYMTDSQTMYAWMRVGYLSDWIHWFHPSWDAFFDGDLAEFVVFGGAMSDDDLYRVGDTLARKHNLPWGLPILLADFDMDGDVNFNDRSILAGNFTGTLDPGIGGFGPDEGDTDGDEDVDFTNFSVLTAEFTGTITAPAGDTLPGEGDVHLEIDLTTGGHHDVTAQQRQLGRLLDPFVRLANRPRRG